MKALIFYGSYIWVPFVLLCVLAVFKRQGGVRWLALFALIASLPLAWARFVEPRLLFTAYSVLDLSDNAVETVAVRVALFGDTHFGTFTHTVSMQRIVDRIQGEDVDLVFIAGDFMMDLPREKVAGAFAALSQLDMPIYGVMGNHDVGIPGPDYGMVLYTELQKAGVTTVENRAFEIEVKGVRIVVAGASELWQGRQSFRFRADLPEDATVLLLTHNPDTALNVPVDFEYDLMLAGHTHGGQIRLPIPALMRRVIPTEYPFDTGLRIMPNGRRVFVTPGTGMTGLPMRFMRPPRVDIINLKIAAK
jgi:predicted MPP superfamily phosphohydrolase